MLDVDPSPALVEWVEVQARELRAHRTIRRPAAEALSRIGQIAVSVQVLGKPDVVTFAAGKVFDEWKS